MAADGNAGLKHRQHGDALDIPPRQGREGRDRVTGGTSISGGRIALRRRPSNEVLMGCFASHGETAEVGSQDESKKDDGSISFQMHGRRGSMRARVLSTGFVKEIPSVLFLREIQELPVAARLGSPSSANPSPDDDPRSMAWT